MAKRNADDHEGRYGVTSPRKPLRPFRTLLANDTENGIEPDDRQNQAHLEAVGPPFEAHFCPLQSRMSFTNKVLKGVSPSQRAAIKAIKVAPHHPSSTLAPTNHPAPCVAIRLRLMPISTDLSAHQFPQPGCAASP